MTSWHASANSAIYEPNLNCARTQLMALRLRVRNGAAKQSLVQCYTGTIRYLRIPLRCCAKSSLFQIEVDWYRQIELRARQFRGRRREWLRALQQRERLRV